LAQVGSRFSICVSFQLHLVSHFAICGTMRTALFVILLQLFAPGVLASQQRVPPLFNITATSLYDAGLQHGRMAAPLIKGWLNGPEMRRIIAWTKGKGSSDFAKIKQVSTAAYPQYVDEIRGIAAGADISLDSAWCLNLISELEALMGLKTAGHCSDIYAVESGGVKDGFSHGHNEDWHGPIKDFWYFVKYEARGEANFGNCAGFVYPGSMVGWAPTWNAHGMYFTANSLFPLGNTPDGVASIFAQRHAYCGKASSGDQEAIVSTLTEHKWSSGMSINMVNLKTGQMANTEVHEDRHSVFQVSKAWQTTAANYSHFNKYKHLGDIAQKAKPSTVHRQARVDELPASRDRQDIMQRLSDSHDKSFPIFRNMTLVTMILDGKRGRMDVWCCGSSAAGGTPPTYSWDLLGFFSNEPAAGAVLV